MRGLCLINSPPVRSDDLDFFAADARKFYSHAKEPILLFLVIDGEGVLMHGYNGIVMCAARPREVWEHLFDSSDMVIASFLSIESRHPQSEPSNCGWRLHPLKRKSVQEAIFNSYLIRSLGLWSSLPVQRRYSLGS
jgi:hypothetical protein